MCPLLRFAEFCLTYSIQIIRKVVDQRFESHHYRGGIIWLLSPSTDFHDARLRPSLSSHCRSRSIWRSRASTDECRVVGSDTTSTAVQSTLLVIILNPLVYAKIRAEIDTAVANGLVSLPIQKYEAGRPRRPASTPTCCPASRTHGSTKW